MLKPVPRVPLTEVQWEAPRDGFGRAILALARENKQVVALCADLTESLRLDSFAREFPERFIETGVAEQNMMGIAAGLALAGKIPFAASFAVFNPGRNWEQLRVAVCYSEANVKVVGSHAGISTGEDGATHQALEDLALTRVLPNLTVLAPTDALEVEKAIHAAADHMGPVYIRFGRAKTATVTTPETPFVIGAANLLREGQDVLICACGPLVYEALVAAEALAGEQIEAAVLAVPTIKPLDSEAILTLARTCGAVVTAEDAQVAGGLGGAVSELLASTYPVPVQRVGVGDRFGQSGTAAELAQEYGLHATTIQQAVHTCMVNKQAHV